MVQEVSVLMVLGDCRGLTNFEGCPLRVRYPPTLSDHLEVWLIPLQSSGLTSTETSAADDAKSSTRD